MKAPSSFVGWLAAVLLSCSAAGAQATPAPPPHDALLELLQDKGILPAGDSSVVRQARDMASDLVLSAMNFLGVPYRRGGNSADEGFDCSGFTRHIFESSIGLALPRRADQQAGHASLLAVKREELRPGDLVFFNTMRRAFSHVGIYMGEGKFIHAPRTGAQVRIEDMRQAYWSQRFNGARRANTGSPVLEQRLQDLGREALPEARP
jgi:cell wall-associated NlpC family hydrolase